MLPPESNCLVLSPFGGEIDDWRCSRPLVPFASEIVDLLGEVSQVLMSNTQSRGHSDVMTFAFWCRPASIHAIKSSYSDLSSRIGRGLVFHVAPMNVPVNFAYSLVAGLLAGNANVVKVPSREFAQVELIVQAFNEVLNEPKHERLQNMIRLVRYPRDQSEITNLLSSMCDVRVIWGGDRSIASIRNSPLEPRSFDVTFADRHSIAILDAHEYVRLTDKRSLAQRFYNDTLLTDQTACTSPHLILWIGAAEIVEQAKSAFWSLLHEEARVRYSLTGVSAISKTAAAFRYLAGHAGAIMSQAPDNLITRVAVAQADISVDQWRDSCGLFYEITLEELSGLVPTISNRTQTVAYFGLEPSRVREIVQGQGLAGIDRVVPIGSTLDFSLHWDGYDLIRTLSRHISVH